MATIWISEYSGFGFDTPGVPALPAKGNQLGSISTAASTLSLGANTGLIGVSADAGCMLLVGSSGSTDVPSSTAGTRIPASVAPQLFAVQPYSRLTFIST